MNTVFFEVGMQENCLICQEKFRKDYIAFENDFWLIRHSEETDIENYFILQPKRHILDLSDANQNELDTYGYILKSLMKHIKSKTGCQRIYTFSLAEAVPHYHLHVIPRSSDFPKEHVGRGITSYPLEPAVQEKLVAKHCDIAKNYFATNVS